MFFLQVEQLCLPVIPVFYQTFIFKESLPFLLSPLSFHLSASVKDKIWKGDFIDILSLFPSGKGEKNRGGTPQICNKVFLKLVAGVLHLC